MRPQPFFILILLFIGLCHGVSEATSCTQRGRFPNNENHDCRGYVMCLMGGLTNFTQYKLTCPQGSIYSHIEQQCTNATSYKCLPDFNCTTASNIVNPESEDCSSYISCVRGINDIATARLIECPANTIFNSTIGECAEKSTTTCHTSILPVVAPPLDKSSTGVNVNEDQPIPANVHPSNNSVCIFTNLLVILIICFANVLI